MKMMSIKTPKMAMQRLIQFLKETQSKMKKEMMILLHLTLRHLQRWHMC